MPQDAESGAKANKYGHKTAKLLAQKMLAVPVSETSNEFAFLGKLITIHCARQATTDVGVTLEMLDRIDTVIGAFESNDGRYEMIEMSPALFRMHMRDSKNEGKVGLVRRKTFQEIGRPLGFHKP